MKTIIISGGSSGIGLACIKKFMDNDYFVYNFDLIDNAHIKNSTQKNYKWLKVDVRNKQEIVGGVATVIHEHAQIDALIASAGKHLSATIENTRDEDILELMQLNVMGAFWLIQSVIPHMKAKNKGNIITIGSDQSSIAKHNSSAYGMTKAALASLTKSIALDYAKYNIRSNCIGAGTIDTPLYRNAIENYSKTSGVPLEQIERDEALEQPVGRIGRPDEVAELAYFLAQDTAAFITGALIPIDGGYTTR
jgi:2-keto-3-deoxy-L-fuconate dehydrogenase